MSVAVPSPWFDAASVKPPLHNQVLVELREGVGTVCDVACYIGKVTSDGETADKWLLTDRRLDARQIKRWAHIYPLPPRNELKHAQDFVRDLLKAVHAASLDREGWDVCKRAEAYLAEACQ